MTEPLTEKEITDSWIENVKPWINAISESQIESRLAVTNQAIIDAVLSQSPQSVLDAGCGEGWLARALIKSNENVEVLGVDVVPELIAYAQKQAIGQFKVPDFKVLGYEALSFAVLQQRFDVIVANFSLLGKASVEYFFSNVAGLLNPGGALIIQTIHPVIGCGDNSYEDGWRTGSWAGFSKDFSNPAPWYFRTLPSWLALFAEFDLTLVEQLEPLHPKTQHPASVIFIARQS